ncbi:MAG: ribulose-phosphate 3-epimerase [Bacilli bacterium]|nr:ribulose-phosphate 3-epimerase [Bacilli bacterium]
MKVATSILSVKENIKGSIDRLNMSNTDYIHLDIMDGIFVENITWHANELIPYLSNNQKPLDVHLMVSNVKSYVDEFKLLNPETIVFHYEAVDDIDSMINYIKSLGIKAGLAIKPNTKIEEIYTYLPKLDEVIVMSVNPGLGGQEFMMPSIDKVNRLKEYKLNNNLNFIINVDGGINNNTIKLVRSADMVVSGSYVTNNNYEESINILKSE